MSALDVVLLAAVSLFLPGCFCLDYSATLDALREANLASSRIKRDAASLLKGISIGGCPFSESYAHRISRRSLDAHEAAAPILNALSDLSSRFGPEIAIRVARQAVQQRHLCHEETTYCDESYPYRTIDGTCNNLLKPLWGAAGTPNERFAPPAYEDGIGQARRHGLSGKCLPSPRLISKMVHMISHEEMQMSDEKTHILMDFGQFLDHDVTMTPQGDKHAACCPDGIWGGNAIKRCEDKPASAEGKCSPRSPENANAIFGSDSDPSEICMPIDLPPDDTLFGVGKECLDFKRSLAVPSGECNIGYREPMNDQTSFIDGSQVYGSDPKLAARLRTRVDGKLLAYPNALLPIDLKATPGCVTNSTAEKCFLAGDTRVNVQPGLASLHTLFVMEHNRITDILKGQLPANIQSKGAAEQDEFLYQEARKIVGAQLQFITYNEFIPGLLGPTNVKKYGLQLERTKTKTFIQSVNPGMRVEFSTFALRVGHTFIPGGVHPMLSSFVPHGNAENFVDLFLNPRMLYEYGYASVLRGIVAEPAKKQGRGMNADLEKVFRKMDGTGLDLASFNIQRSRDHGIPSYTEMRRYCGLSVPRTFDELEMLNDTIAKLKTVYESVHDIDPFTGAVSELKSYPDASVGPLNACILGKQFYALKAGDRFWFENDSPVGFSTGQLTEIYKSSLGRVICDNIQVNLLQQKVMAMASDKNAKRPCFVYPSMNLANWFTK